MTGRTVITALTKAGACAVTRLRIMVTVLDTVPWIRGTIIAINMCMVIIVNVQILEKCTGSGKSKNCVPANCIVVQGKNFCEVTPQEPVSFWAILGLILLLSVGVTAVVLMLQHWTDSMLDMGRKK